MSNLEEQLKISKIGHKFGHQLIDAGIKWIRLAYKLKPQVFTRVAIMSFLTDQLGLLASTISLADEKYHVETWNKFGQIADFDLLNLQEYKSDFFDCDNYSFVYASRGGLIYGLNSFFVAFGNIYDLTGKYIGRHAFNLILTHQNGVLKLYCYEPMNDNSNQVIKGQKIVLIHGWEYRPDWIIGF